MWRSILAFGKSLLDSLRDLAPIILVIAFFQLVVLQQPIPNLAGLLGGTQPTGPRESGQRGLDRSFPIT